ncbi:SIMPL domain-containing protein [Flavobacterium sp. MAH-1]|uniref:SIMPL domain-containing protein n=1 Tax=Flavobacterium agri TaxID=2743471 RepID=A0A7Y8Y000_9FLAO|nr:SIMPL domain-containing protein [Flavobacterium agri]NUY79852.1 SIMPL domain-containing protein [Flavobacterium agri]NYA69877.1 SIMPL domain-containing protein [Flavobacterium agri]
MKKFFLLSAVLVSMAATSQIQVVDQKPQINVSGEGKVKVTPDQAHISIGIENKGANATEIKKQNDLTTEKVIQFLKKFNLPKGDVQTQKVSLTPQYDYDKKKYSYIANQTIVIFLRNLDKYDELMSGLVDTGINRVNYINFESSKEEQFKSDARKLAMQDAKRKADDYVSVLTQKVGKALMVNDNTQIIYPRAEKFMAMANADAMAGGAPETLAIGEIEVTANVSVSFLLD